MPAAPTEPNLRSTLARRAALALATLALATLALASRADGYIYWANAGTNTIGRANLDGDPSSVNQGFIGSDGANVPAGVAVTGANIYWTNEGPGGFGTIGRANVDGGGVDNDFVDEGPTIPDDPVSVAVDDQYLYWADDSEFLPIIGRAGVVVGNDEYRVGTDLSDPAQNPQFARLVNEPLGVAVFGGQLYWANHGTQTIGRADLDSNGNVSNASQLIPRPLLRRQRHRRAGGRCELHLLGERGHQHDRTRRPPQRLERQPELHHRRQVPRGVAVDDNYIYWANQGTNTIGRADINGDPSSVNQAFIKLPAGSSPAGVAVDALPAACASQAATIAGTGRPDKLGARTATT